MRAGRPRSQKIFKILLDYGTQKRAKYYRKAKQKLDKTQYKVLQTALPSALRQAYDQCVRISFLRYTEVSGHMNGNADETD